MLPFGSICTLKLCKDRRNNLSLGYGYVTFEHHHDEENAPEALNFLELIGKPIYIIWGQDMTVNVLLSGKESNTHDRHVEEIGPAEPSHGEEGNTVQIL